MVVMVAWGIGVPEGFLGLFSPKTATFRVLGFCSEILHASKNSKHVTCASIFSKFTLESNLDFIRFVVIAGNAKPQQHIKISISKVF